MNQLTRNAHKKDEPAQDASTLVQPQQQHFWMCSNNHLNVSKEYYIEAETEDPVSRILQILPECLLSRSI